MPYVIETLSDILEFLYEDRQREMMKLIGEFLQLFIANSKKKLQSGQLTIWPVLKLSTSRIRTQNITATQVCSSSVDIWPGIMI
jgi:hypothetical protein